MLNSSDFPPVAAGRRSLVRFVAAGVFVLWIGLSGGILLELSRTGCALPRQVIVSAVSVPSGWRMEHWLPSHQTLTDTLAERLIRQGPRAGIAESIRIDGDDPVLAARLTQTRWQVQTNPGDDKLKREPQLRIFSPSGECVWSGGYRSEEVMAVGAIILDDLVLAQIASGRRFPPMVPVGCGLPAKNEAPARNSPILAIFDLRL